MSSSECYECESKRLIEFAAELTEGCQVVIGDLEYKGDLPNDIGIGEKDMVSFIYCADCGLVQDDFPLEETNVESKEAEESDDD